MLKITAIAAVLLCLGSLAQANITIDTVAVGNSGNAGDARPGYGGYGSVAYNYNIGKYEVTAGQYTAFLNAKAKTDPYGLYSTHMAIVSDWGCNIQRTGASGNYSYSVASDWANRPVGSVSYWDACRFANWLGNGQGTGSTETGAYTLNGYNGTDGRTIVRNAGWTWAVTSENEWYKAAYYKGGSTNAGYWNYTVQSDTYPGRDMADVSGNNANYYWDGLPIDSGKYTTVVGEFQNSDTFYGTFDQGGNVMEWNQAIVSIRPGGAGRGLRGGSFESYNHTLTAWYRDSQGYSNNEAPWFGFRVVRAVPEPSSILALLGGLLGLLGIRRRVRKTSMVRDMYPGPEFPGLESVSLRWLAGGRCPENLGTGYISCPIRLCSGVRADRRLNKRWRA